MILSRPRRRRRRAVPVLVTGALILGLACSGDDGASPDPDQGPAEPTTTSSIVDLSGVVLPTVAGTTTTSILEQGDAAIVGTVTGPDGPVAGATVRMERIVGGTATGHDAVTDAEGRYEARGIPGGRYRLRAFLPPTLAQVEPEVRFLRDREAHEIDLRVEAHGGLAVAADVAPEPPFLGLNVNLVAVVGTRVVDADGVVRATPAPGVSVELSGLGRWVLRPEDPPATSSTGFSFFPTTTTRPTATPFAVTDADGRVRFELRCVRTGPPGLALTVPVRRAAAPTDDDPAATTTTLGGGVGAIDYERLELDLPDCVDPATLTTTTAPTGSGDGGSGDRDGGPGEGTTTATTRS